MRAGGLGHWSIGSTVVAIILPFPTSTPHPEKVIGSYLLIGF